MIVGAVLLMMANSLTLQDTSTKLTALFAGGLLGLYCLGFLTRRGDGRAVAVGIVCTVLFTGWMTAIELKWINLDGVLASGLPAWVARPMDTYYAGIIGNVVMFTIGYLAALLLPSRQRDLTNLTVWTRDGLDEDEPAIEGAMSRERSGA
jgi:SSS family solute:Na+ symporter